MPDKSVVSIPAWVRMKCPELLFNPELDGKSCKSMHQLAWSSIKASDMDTRVDLCKNIILSGGSSMYEGIADRLKKELTQLVPVGA